MQGPGRQGHERAQGGFSLIEMLIALALAAILIGLAAPSLRSLTGQSRISATINDFVYAMQSARSEAIKRASFVEICASRAPLGAEPGCDAPDFSIGWIVYADEDGSGDREADEPVLLQNAVADDRFTFDSVNPAAASRLRFDEDGASVRDAGGPLSTSIRVEHDGGEQARVVKIAATGRIATQRTP